MLYAPFGHKKHSWHIRFRKKPLIPPTLLTPCRLHVSTSFLCSDFLTPNFLPVSPMYTESQFAHLISYTQEHTLSVSILSLGWTTNCLMVVHGLYVVLMACCFIILVIFSERPFMYGIVTWPLDCSLFVFGLDLFLLCVVCSIFRFT